MSPRRLALAALPALPAALAAATAWADHGVGLRPETNPIVTALVWAGATLLLGMAIVVVVTVLSRRRSPAPRDG